MWFRGRTVVAIVMLTAFAVCTATYVFVKLPDWGFNSPSIQTGGASPQANSGLKQNELDKINKVLALIEQRYMAPTDRAKLLDGAVQGMIEALNDPYSVYKSAEEAEKYSEALSGAFTGIGAELRIQNGAVVVEAPIRGSPAERAGLQPRDILLSINGESLHGLTLSEAVMKIRGPKGTKAKLKVQRNGLKEPLDLELVRDRIDLETVHAEFMTDGIGILTINQFTEETSARFAEELKKMENGGLKALIIDVRDNPGGLLQSVIEIADLLMEKGKPIVQSAYRDGQLKVDVAQNGARNHKYYPMLVLVNKGSASAAEILAGALQQSADAVLVGETTYGKGTVQVPFSGDLGDRSLVKLSVYKWLLPDGTWVNEKGIEPDIPIAQPDYYQASRLPRDRVLGSDSAGEAVSNLQTILAGVGFAPDRMDGYYSEGTRLAVEKFQRSQSLAVTGDINEETAQRLEEALYENLQDRKYDKQWQIALAKAREWVLEAAE